MRKILYSILPALLLCLRLHAEEPTNRMATASFDELLVHIQCYGSTEAKSADKRLAQAEVLRRGEAALAYLMDHAKIENDWIFIMADNLVRQLSADQAVPVLLRYLDAPEPATRKMAAYWLGFHSAPEHGSLLLPLLAQEETAGAAMRTLGKWKTAAAVPGIRPYLAHKEERLRIRAVNALRDIGSDEALPDLIAATGDPLFTVRKAASRALAAFGERAERPVLDALPHAQRPSRRELISVLGTIPTRGSIKVLRGLLRDPDPLLREDAARALLRAAPAKARPWLKEAGLSAAGLVLEE